MYAEDELTLQDDDGRNDYRVPALFRGLLILQMFNAQTRTLSMNELAEGLGVTVSAIYRIVHTLTEMGYLRKLAKNTYELGPQVVSDGFSYLASRDLVDIAAPHLNALRDRTSLSCHLSIREQTDSLYIYRAFAAQRLSVNIPIGTRIPCHCTAMGRMLLTGLSPAALDALYQSVRLDDHPPPAPKTLPAATFRWSMANPVTSESLSTPARSLKFTVVNALRLRERRGVQATCRVHGSCPGELRASVRSG